MKSSHQSVYFNNIPVSSTLLHKHLGMLLDDKLSYEHYLKFVLNKVKTTIGLLRKFQQILLRQSLTLVVWSIFLLRTHPGRAIFARKNLQFNDPTIIGIAWP